MSVTMPAIRVTRSVYDRIQALAQEQHEPMGAVIERLITQEEERRFWEETNAAYATFRADPQAWAEEEAFRAELDGTIRDGLELEAAS